MEVKEFMKEWRVWVLLLALGISTLWIGPSYETRNGEVVLTTQLEDRTGIQFSGGTRMLLTPQTNATGQELQDIATDVKDVLGLRIATSSIADAQVRVVDLGDGNYKLQLQTANTNQTKLKELIKQQGSFEARMPLYVRDAENITVNYQNRTVLQFDKQEQNISVSRFSDTGEVKIAEYQPGTTFIAADTTFIYKNSTEAVSKLEIVAYTGEDILEVSWNERRTRGSGNQFRTSFPIQLQRSAAMDTGLIFSNYLPSITGDNSQLVLENGSAARLRLYVDSELRNALTVAAGLGEEPYSTTSSISAVGSTPSEARDNAKELQTILKSGKLPVPLKIESVSRISAALGSQFMLASILSIIGSLVAVGALVFVRYDDIRYALPIVLTGASEVYILLGFWSWFTQLGSISLSAIAGIIAAVGTGVDDQIIITDESGKEQVRSVSERMKRAFFVIFTSAASTIGAMFPILSAGTASTLIGIAGAGLIGYAFYSRNTNYSYVAIGSLALAMSVVTSAVGPSSAALQTIHGFAATTILGILIGITVTRPAYSKYVEYIEKDK
ncbi:hypothetical protein GKQ38_04640 [Candidatus Nanohaloarchaea archaeon]|nr:hypothetical protein GKQ38_04640 [Candidatus Nanohaloarchaea archaeon]